MMSGRTGFQSWTNSNYKHGSGFCHQSEDMWDDEPSSSVSHVTQVFHNQSLTNAVNSEWDAWDCSYTPKTVSSPENCNSVRNAGGFEYQRDGVCQSSAFGQPRERFGQQNESLDGNGDSAPFDMRISSRHIGLVIGRGGSRIKELQGASGAKINFKKNDVDASGMVPITLEGDATSRNNAKRMIDELIESDSNNAGRLDNTQNRQTSEHFGDGGSFRDASGLAIASNMLGAVIGRGGQKIREIECKTQTKIKIADNRFGATVEVTISGNEDGRRHAKQLIEDVIQSESEAGSVQRSQRPDFDGRYAGNQQVFGSGSTELQVPTSMLGAIIGRGGQNIKDISDKTQAKIKISDDRSGTVVDVTVTGSENGRLEAKSMIEDVIRSAGERRYVSNSEESSFSGCHNGNQHGSGFGDLDHTDRSQSMQTSARSGFGDSNASSRQRSGFGDLDPNETNDRPQFMPKSARSGFGDNNAGSQQRSGFGNFDHFEPSNQSFGNSGRSSFGSSAPRHGFSGTVINWDHVKQLSELHEAEKWKGYPPIKKNFYIEDAGVANMEPEEIAAIREQNNNIMVNCDEDSEMCVPNPVRTFDEGFLHYPEILSELKRAGFTKPSPIQMQGWPIALQGLDLIGIAQTGTGKTLAFLLPAFIHIEGQPVPRGKRGGPNVLVLSPTRELALQIEQEVKKYKYRDINCVCVYGGGNRREQINIVTKGVEIVVATPGRLNDLIANGIIDVKSVTYLVLDEADRMLDLGFEPEIRKILIDIRPDRQTIMTSATWPAGVRRLATSYMKNPIRVFVGSLDLTAVHSVHQRVEIVQEEEKRNRLVEFLTQEMADDDKAIVFVGRKCTVDSISSDFALSDIRCQSIHGGREQCDREQALDDLKDGVVRILIATDVASRGLDIKDVTHVVNFDFPHNIEEYVHRVGRTGRAGRSGESLTFMTRADWRHASELIKIMEEAQQEVPREVYEMAQRYSANRERRRNEDSDRGSRGDFDDFSGFGGSFGGGGRRGGRRDRERSLKVAYM